jgi:hypothetical protein
MLGISVPEVSSESTVKETLAVCFSWPFFFAMADPVQRPDTPIFLVGAVGQKLETSGLDRKSD